MLKGVDCRSAALIIRYRLGVRAHRTRTGAEQDRIDRWAHGQEGLRGRGRTNLPCLIDKTGIDRPTHLEFFAIYFHPSFCRQAG